MDEISHHTSFTIDENPVEARITVPDGDVIEGVEDDKEDAPLPAEVDPSNSVEADNSLDLEVGMSAHDETTSIDEDDCYVEECGACYLMLTCKRQVPNCCAICLSPYDVGDAVVWSSNKACKHAFHAQCMVDYFTKMQDGTPCPCCRQEFTDLDAQTKNPKRITWAPGSFDPNTIALR